MLISSIFKETSRKYGLRLPTLRGFYHNAATRKDHIRYQWRPETSTTVTQLQYRRWEALVEKSRLFGWSGLARKITRLNSTRRLEAFGTLSHLQHTTTHTSSFHNSLTFFIKTLIKAQWVAHETVLECHLLTRYPASPVMCQLSRHKRRQLDHLGISECKSTI